MIEGNIALKGVRLMNSLIRPLTEKQGFLKNHRHCHPMKNQNARLLKSEIPSIWMEFGSVGVLN